MFNLIGWQVSPFLDVAASGVILAALFLLVIRFLRTRFQVYIDDGYVIGRSATIVASFMAGAIETARDAFAGTEPTPEQIGAALGAAYAILPDVMPVRVWGRLIMIPLKVIITEQRFIDFGFAVYSGYDQVHDALVAELTSEYLAWKKISG